MADFGWDWNYDSLYVSVVESGGWFSYHCGTTSPFAMALITRPPHFCPPMVTQHEQGVINLWSNQGLVSGWLTEGSLWGSSKTRVKRLPGDPKPWQRDDLSSCDSLEMNTVSTADLCSVHHCFTRNLTLILETSRKKERKKDVFCNQSASTYHIFCFKSKYSHE